LGDWTGPLAEFRRVLRRGGRLILSINHPTVRLVTAPTDDYFATYCYSEDFEFAGKKTTLEMWHRPLSTIMNTFTAAGFNIALAEEPKPSPDTPKDLLPARMKSGERSGFLAFLFFVLA
jgi:hypothetical protein